MVSSRGPQRCVSASGFQTVTKYKLHRCRHVDSPFCQQPLSSPTKRPQCLTSVGARKNVFSNCLSKYVFTNETIKWFFCRWTNSSPILTRVRICRYADRYMYIFQCGYIFQWFTKNLPISWFIHAAACFHGWKNCPLLAMCLSQSASQRLRICIHSSLSSDKRATRWHLSGASLSAYSPLVFAATAECCVVVDLPEQKHLPRTAADHFDFQSFSCPLEGKLFFFFFFYQRSQRCCRATRDNNLSDFQFNLNLSLFQNKR